MVYYKIISLTTKLPKRHSQKDSAIKIDYRNKFDQKEYSLPAGGCIYISTPSLPSNLHKLRMKKFIAIVEIGKNTFMKLSNPDLVKKSVQEIEVVEEPKVEKPKKVSRRKKEETTLIVKEE